MNKTILPIAFIAGCFVSSSAMAISANTITFQGEVTAQTCSVSINGNDASPIVLLPTVAATELANPGDVAGQTVFTLGVTGCTKNDAADTNIKTVFVGNNVTNSGNLGNTGGAGNVELQILKSTQDTAGINLTSPQSVDGLVLKKGDTEATHDFAVQYYATAAATPGTVAGSLQYAISYQ